MLVCLCCLRQHNHSYDDDDDDVSFVLFYLVKEFLIIHSTTEINVCARIVICVCVCA